MKWILFDTLVQELVTSRVFESKEDAEYYMSLNVIDKTHVVAAYIAY